MYILDPEQQRRLLRGMILVGSEDDGWLERYVDDHGDEWTLYHPFPEGHGGGPRYLRRGHPPEADQDVPAWVITLLQSGREEDADGAATDLLDRFEIWEAVLNRIEAEYDSLDPYMVSVFIEELGIVDASNRRPILGKPFAEIAADAAHFAALSHRAVRLYRMASRRDQADDSPHRH